MFNCLSHFFSCDVFNIVDMVSGECTFESFDVVPFVLLKTEGSSSN